MDELIEMIFRDVAHSPNAVAHYSEAQIKDWPKEIQEALKKSYLLQRNGFFESFDCNECDHECHLNVERVKISTGIKKLGRCEKRDDVGFVSAPESQLRKWSVSLVDIAKFMAKELGLNFNGSHSKNKSEINIGRVSIGESAVRIAIRKTSFLEIVVGNKKEDLKDLFFYQGSKIGILLEVIQKWLESDPDCHLPDEDSSSHQRVKKVLTANRDYILSTKFKKLKNKYPHLKGEAIVEMYMADEMKQFGLKAQSIVRYARNF